MPIVLVSTLTESGQTNLGPYSLVVPHLIADHGKYSMMLITRAGSNSAMNLRRSHYCAINFVPNEKKYLKNEYRFSWRHHSSLLKKREERKDAHFKR